MRFLFVDRILQLELGKRVQGIKHITPDEPYLYQNKEGQACFYSSFIGEALGQLAAWNVMATNDFTMRPVAGVVNCARLYRPAYVGETLFLESIIDELDDSAVRYHSVARIDDEVVFTIDGALGPLLPMTKFISADEVRRQFDEINRPGEWCPSSQKIMLLSGLLPLSPLSNVHMHFDSLLCHEPGVSLTAEKRITRSAPYFPDHFPYQPVLPMTVLLACKLNLTQVFLQQAGFDSRYEIRELQKIKMNDFVYPGDVLHCHLKLIDRDKHSLLLRYRSEVSGKRVCVLDIILQKKGN